MCWCTYEWLSRFDAEDEAVAVEEYEEDEETAEDGAAEILLSLPRPLMPLLEFLYKAAKYSQRSLS